MELSGFFVTPYKSPSVAIAKNRNKNITGREAQKAAIRAIQQPPWCERTAMARIRCSCSDDWLLQWPLCARCDSQVHHVHVICYKFLLFAVTVTVAVTRYLLYICSILNFEREEDMWEVGTSPSRSQNFVIMYVRMCALYICTCYMYFMTLQYVLVSSPLFSSPLLQIIDPTSIIATACFGKPGSALWLTWN